MEGQYVPATEIERIDRIHLAQLGLDEMLENGVSLIVEWFDLIRPLLPPVDLEIQIDAPTKDSRNFSFFSNTENGLQILNALKLENRNQS